MMRGFQFQNVSASVVFLIHTFILFFIMMNTKAENFRNFNSIQFAFSHTNALFSIHGASCHKKPALSSAINTQPWLGLFSGWLQAQSVSVSGIGRFWYSTQNQSLLTRRAPIQTTSPSSVNWFGMQWLYMLIITLTTRQHFWPMVLYICGVVFYSVERGLLLMSCVQEEFWLSWSEWTSFPDLHVYATA